MNIVNCIAVYGNKTNNRMNLPQRPTGRHPVAISANFTQKSSIVLFDLGPQNSFQCGCLYSGAFYQIYLALFDDFMGFKRGFNVAFWTMWRRLPEIIAMPWVE